MTRSLWPPYRTVSSFRGRPYRVADTVAALRRILVLARIWIILDHGGLAIKAAEGGLAINISEEPTSSLPLENVGSLGRELAGPRDHGHGPWDHGTLHIAMARSPVHPLYGPQSLTPVSSHTAGPMACRTSLLPGT